MKPFRFRDETIFTQTCLRSSNIVLGATYQRAPVQIDSASCPNRIVANAPHFEEVASEAKSPCQHGVLPSSCIFRRRVDPFEAARRARFHKLGRKATERSPLSACHTCPTFRVNRRPPDATDGRATDRGWNNHGAAALPRPVAALSLAAAGVHATASIGSPIRPPLAIVLALVRLLRIPLLGCHGGPSPAVVLALVLPPRI